MFSPLLSYPSFLVPNKTHLYCQQVCSWTCSAGYWETSSSLPSCSPCPTLPAGAHWLPISDPDFAPCAASCDPGLYGQALAGGDPCLNCSLYMQSPAAAGLYPPPPAVGGIWNNSYGQCDADSWACAPGFRRSPAGDRYCCPLSIAHASPAGPGGGGPCEVTCNAGFWWNVSAANCTACSGLPSNAQWLSSAAANGQVRATTLSYSVFVTRL